MSLEDVDEIELAGSSHGGDVLPEQSFDPRRKPLYQIPQGHAARLDPNFAMRMALVCITAFYDPNPQREKVAAHVVSVVQEWPFSKTQTVLFTQNSQGLSKSLAAHHVPLERVQIVEPVGVNDPSRGPPGRILAWAHRMVMQRDAMAYDIFVYLEDDIELTWPKLVAWWHDEQEVQLYNARHPYQPPMHRGFFRYEYRGSSVLGAESELPVMVTVDPGACHLNFATHACRLAVRSIKGEKDNKRRYIGLPNPYSASWVMDRDRLLRFIASSQWRSLPSGRLPGVPWPHRETAAAGDAFLGFTNATRMPRAPTTLSSGCFNAMVIPYHSPRKKKGNIIDAIAGLHHVSQSKRRFNKSIESCLARNIPAHQAALV